MMLRADADRTLRNVEGKTPLELAQSEEAIELVESPEQKLVRKEKARRALELGAVLDDGRRIGGATGIFEALINGVFDISLDIKDTFGVYKKINEKQISLSYNANEKQWEVLDNTGTEKLLLAFIKGDNKLPEECELKTWHVRKILSPLIIPTPAAPAPAAAKAQQQAPSKTKKIAVKEENPAEKEFVLQPDVCIKKINTINEF